MLQQNIANFSNRFLLGVFTKHVESIVNDRFLLMCSSPLLSEY